jgi:hypothetical protein
MLYSQYGSGVGVSVGRGVAVGVRLRVGRGVCVVVAEGVVVAVGGTGVFPAQAGRKTTKSTINKSVYFIESILYMLAV